MKRRVLQVLLGVAGIIMFVRFGIPAVIFGATGPGPMGERWLAEGVRATPLLDSDLRFFGMMLLGLGALFFSMIRSPETHGRLVRILCVAVVGGACARIAGFALFGLPSTPGLIATGIEVVLPVLVFVLQRQVAGRGEAGPAREGALGA